MMRSVLTKVMERLPTAIDLTIHRLHGIAHQRSGAKVDIEPRTPNRCRAILRQIDIRGNVVVLVADVSLQRAKVDKAGSLYRIVVLCVPSSHEINVDIRAVGSCEVGQA